MSVSLNRRVYSHRQRRDYFLPRVINTKKGFYRTFNFALGVREHLPPLFKQEKTEHLKSDTRSCLKSGDYLSSRQFSASTLGVRKLNFCVRNGNRWILSAIITAMVIYHVLSDITHTYCTFSTHLYRFLKNNLLSRRLTTT